MKRPFTKVHSLSLTCLLLLAACGDPSASGTRAADSAEQTTVQAADDTAGLSDAEVEVLAGARAVLAAHLKVQDVSESVLVQITEKQWSNGSLGCAKPGLNYAMVIINGHKVVLSLNGVQHHVHMGPLQRGQLSGRVCGRLQDSALEDVTPPKTPPVQQAEPQAK